MQFVWKIIQNPPLHRRQFDGDDVVFNELTGDTHKLSPLASALLRALESSAKTSAELLPILLEESEDDPAALEQALSPALVSLFDLGLITREEL